MRLGGWLLRLPRPVAIRVEGDSAELDVGEVPKPRTPGIASSSISRWQVATDSAGSSSTAAVSSGWVICSGVCIASPNTISRWPGEVMV
jgi:hypothetical protein